MFHFKRKNIFDVSCKVWSPADSNANSCWSFYLEVPLMALVVASAELYSVFSKFWWNELLYALSYMMSP